jgi:hypothetical protein
MEGGGVIAFLFLVLFIVAVLTTLFFVLKRRNKLSQVQSILSSSPADAAAAARVPGSIASQYGSITNTPAGAAIVAQVRASTPGPSPPPSIPDKLKAFLDGLLSALLSEATVVQLIADLIVHGGDSMVGSLVKKLAEKIAKLPALEEKISSSISKRWAERTMTGSIKYRFPTLDVLKRARLGLSWGKESTKLGENVASELKSAAGASFDVTSAISDAGARLAAGTADAAKAGANMALGMATDPLTVSMVVGMVLDSKNVGNFAKLSQTSDLLNERNNQLKTTYNTTIDCYSWPPGPTCPPSPAPPAASPAPVPTPKAGRYPQFFGPHDLMDPSVIMANMQTKIYSLISDPGDPNGGFKKTIDLIAALPQTGPVPGVLTSLTNLFDSINFQTGTADSVMAPFTWAAQVSQQTIQTAATTLKGVPGTDRIVARLNILLAMQGIVSNYIVQILQNNGNDIDMSTFTTLVMTPFPDSITKPLIDAEMDQDCLDNGGVVFNPGNGWDAHTCTWATKEDCHGSYPWMGPGNKLVDGLTPNTTKLLCMTTCPAPSPAGSPGPAPQVPCPAPSPCPAISDPTTKANMYYSEWRNKDWFSKSNLIDTGGAGAWNANLNQSAIPSAGACIIGDAGFHHFCDTPQIVGMCSGSNPSANNIYDRTTGTCVNSQQLCTIKGVSFNPSLPASSLGSGDVEGVSYPSCYVGSGQTIAQDLVGDTITRFYNAGAQVCVPFKPIPTVNTGNAALNTVVNGITQDVLNPIGATGAKVVGDIATGVLDAVGAVASAAAPVAGAIVTGVTSTPQAFSSQNIKDTGNALACAIGAGSCTPTCPAGQVASTTSSGRTACGPDCGTGTWVSTGDLTGYCQQTCRPDQIHDAAGKCTCYGTSKPIDFGAYCGTTANCPACPSGQIFQTSWDCSCGCSSVQWNYNGTCYNNNQCPPGYWVKAGVMTVSSINDCTPVVTGQKPPPQLLSSSCSGCTSGYPSCTCTFMYKMGDGSIWTSPATSGANYNDAAASALSQAISVNNKVDCVVSAWTDTSRCGTGVCNTMGTKTQSRTITTQPSNGGAACPALTQTVTCANASCPGTSTSNPCPYGLSQDGVKCNTGYPNPNTYDNNLQMSTNVLVQASLGQIPGVCTPGQYMGPTGTNCYNCPQNTYQPYYTLTKSGNICAPCPPGKGAIPGSASCQ